MCCSYNKAFQQHETVIRMISSLKARGLEMKHEAMALTTWSIQTTTIAVSEDSPSGDSLSLKDSQRLKLLLLRLDLSDLAPPAVPVSVRFSGDVFFTYPLPSGAC